MKLVIIEDEPLAAERMQFLLKQYDPNVQVDATLESIDEAVKWFSGNPSPVLSYQISNYRMDLHLRFSRRYKYPAP